jgi:hypothetical protein
LSLIFSPLTVYDFSKIDIVHISSGTLHGLESGLASGLGQNAFQVFFDAGVKTDHLDDVPGFHLLEVVADLEEGERYDRFTQIEGYHHLKPPTVILLPDIVIKIDTQGIKQCKCQIEQMGKTNRLMRYAMLSLAL